MQSSTSASTTRLRCDPTEYAKKQQAAKDRAIQLKEQRQRGIISDDHTFAPKVNPKAGRNQISSREEQDRTVPPPSTSSFDDIPIRPSKTYAATSRKEADEMNATSSRNNNGTTTRTRSNNNNNHQDDGSDALDSLSRRYPNKPAPKNEESASYSTPTPLNPEHDTLFREVKKATGKELSDAKPSQKPATMRGGGPCLRNSSCTCPQCAGVMDGGSNNRPDPPIRRRESRPSVNKEEASLRQSSYGGRSLPPQSEIEDSLSLLKSKMSRRKARSAPTNQASLFVEKTTPREMYSARESTSGFASGGGGGYATSSSSTYSQPASRRQEPPAQPPPRRTQAPPPQPPKPLSRHVEEQDEEQELNYPGPLTRQASQDLDEYAEDEGEMHQCPTCQRRFNVLSFEKHQRVCAKVFAGSRKVFNMKDKRLEGTGAEKVQKKSDGSSGSRGGGGGRGHASADNQVIKQKAVDWKQKSNAFREAMKASRDVTKALKEGRELPPTKPSAPDPSLIQCEYCSRRFNDKAAERHIPFCREKTQRDSISKGPPKKTSAPPPKPTRAAPARKK